MSSTLQLGKFASKHDMMSMLDIIDSALQVGTQAQFRSLMRLTLDLLPIEKTSVCVAEIDSDNAILRNNHQININYPAQWVSVYRQRAFNRVDPVARQLFIRQRPLIWSQLRERVQTPLHKAFYGAAAEFGLKDGFAFGARFDNSSSGSFFSCVGEDLAKHKRHQVLLNYLVPHLHVALSRMHLGHQKNRPQLTPREIEVLTWAKYGKTNWEISVLLAVSARVVKFHMENAMRKLNVVNRTQAIAVALSLGLIRWS